MASTSSLLFVIVGKNEPLYEAEFHKSGSTLVATQQNVSSSSSTSTADSVTRQNYFVLHSALDLVEKAQWITNNMYLKVVDKVNHQQVSTFLTAGNIKFMLLHGGRSEDSIKNFFTDIYELYVKLSMNPFYKYDTPISSKNFDTRVRAIARRYLS
uniref:Trafficking protein particle complex subunit n=1 Tax=Helicotheca tamesis TaxID=374047 RepID=A0A7S2N4C3_9STRA|mmetsp:Transcript_9392/g.13065  ORF Transcript_9392/g.13065 Transcript_9392/m.13065 type:complete len:155 (+) Transcript_9392:132-596(+)|eukprot:CAMPEP_0185728360 /NCGR_PEP_ID=MMETSP1171-20130828/3731_1 /TAXON_ID=374046 /ORGANISM="Helicotheca tamensis, Strain CCMP826" /LENGTH=154 /DNA_ID=CAMNT_0028397061 /DNA_START=133 /DNA_END=597 /DNA_ORIENTATION=+